MTNWSKYQLSLFDFFKSGNGSAIVNAVAGSGKTTSIVEASKYIPIHSKSIFLAFNKSIAEELGRRLPTNVESRTLNSLGFKVWKAKVQGRIAVNNGKNYQIAKEVLNVYGVEDKRAFSPFIKLIGLCKQYGYVPSNFSDLGLSCRGEDTVLSLQNTADLINHYDVDFSNCEDLQPYPILNDMLIKSVKDVYNIDYDDMMYLPVVYGVINSNYDYIIVDEAQDVSHIQREMIGKFLNKGGRLIAVGDPAQAIYGFRGADSNSMNNIKNDFNCVELPLSVSYRCPKEVVKIAKRYMPNIEYSDTAIEGLIRTENEFDLKDFNQKTDIVMCRNIAPLVDLAYLMLSSGFAAYVAGRDIAKGLIVLVRSIIGNGKGVNSIEDFEEKLNYWAYREIAKAQKSGNETKIESIEDKAETLSVFMSSPNVNAPKDIIDQIDLLFSEGQGLRLSSIHKAKGLEAKRAFIYKSDLLPSKYAKRDWQIQQENNLIYVAVTRALEELIYLNDVKR